MKTMDDEYRDGTDCLVCPKCGFCSTCRDCRCGKTNPKVFILNGYPRSGKNCFADFMVDELFDSRHLQGNVVSSVDNVKWAAEILGWDKKKDENGRNALSALKDFSSKWWDGPYQMMKDYVNGLSEDEVVIFMVREPEEIERFVKEFPETVTIFIERENCETASNHADSEVENFLYDFYITNNGTLENLENSARGLIEYLYREKTNV